MVAEAISGLKEAPTNVNRTRAWVGIGTVVDSIFVGQKFIFKPFMMCTHRLSHRITQSIQQWCLIR